MFFLLNFAVLLRLKNLFVQASLANFWQSLNFMRFGWVFRVVFLQMAGLPPVFVFFIKFSFLLTAFHISTIFICFLVFINLLLSMFFYLQLFKTAPDNFADMTVFRWTTKKAFIRRQLTYTYNQKLFSLMYYFFLFFFINIFGYCFYTDFFIIMQAFFV